MALENNLRMFDVNDKLFASLIISHWNVILYKLISATEHECLKWHLIYYINDMCSSGMQSDCLSFKIKNVMQMCQFRIVLICEYAWLPCTNTIKIFHTTFLRW